MHICARKYRYIDLYIYITCTELTYIDTYVAIFVVHGQRSGDHGFSLLPLSSSCYPCISPGAFGTDFCGKQDVKARMKGISQKEHFRYGTSFLVAFQNRWIIEIVVYWTGFSMRLFGWVCYTSPPFGVLKLCFSKTGTFIVCKPGSLQEISCQQTQSCVNLCHDTCGMGIFTILQKGILLLFQSWVWCTTPRATCFFFSAHFHHHLLLPCFKPPPAPPEKKTVRKATRVQFSKLISCSFQN